MEKIDSVNTLEIDVLNEIDKSVGGNGGNVLKIDALNSIDKSTGGAGDHATEIDALTSIAGNVSSNPSGE